MEQLLKDIQEADLILIGLGEEFDCKKLLKTIPEYSEKIDLLQQYQLEWLIPLCNQLYLKNTTLELGLLKLQRLLQDKNYFVLSITNHFISQNIPWNHHFYVNPCLTSRLQCSDGCHDALVELSDEKLRELELFIESLNKSSENVLEELEKITGKCSQCNKPMVLNTVYHEHYLEEGYLKKWGLYQKWLQGTLNKRVVVLELGVLLGMPNVIRWPFEKITFFNHKAKLYRINDSLYQLPPELHEKGSSIKENAIDWLNKL